MERRAWARRTTTDEAYRRAAGRRRVNSVRRAQAAIRRQQVVQLALEMHMGLKQRGICPRIASIPGVHRGTIWRDVRAVLAMCRLGDECPACGRLLADDR